MIPLRDDQPTNSFPIITIVLIVVNVLVFLASQILNLSSSYAMVPYEITHNVDLVGTRNFPIADVSGAVVHMAQIYYGPDPRPIWLTIFSSMFLHEGWLHLGGNMLFLWIFGNNIEDALGKVRFILFYFLCGWIAAIAQIATDWNSIIPSVGASGAIAGVLGAYLILYPRARVLTIVPLIFAFLMELPAVVVLLLWIVLQIIPGVSSLHSATSGGGVAYFAHIGGFFAGIFLINRMGGRKLVARQYRESNRQDDYRRVYRR